MAAEEIRIDVELRWRDLDFLGHLNQSVYHELLEEGRGALFERLGVLDDRLLLRARARRARPPPGDPPRPRPGHDRAARRGGRALERHVSHEIVRNDGEVAAEGRSVLVAWDREARRSRPLTDAERAQLS